MQSDGTDAPVGGGGSGDVQVATVPVSSAEILALADTYKDLIEGVPGFVPVVTCITVAYLAGETPYTDAGGYLVMAVGPATYWQLTGGGFVDQAESQLFIPTISLGTNAVPAALADLGGEDLALYYAYATPEGTNLTDGDGTLSVTFAYFMVATS